MFIRLKFVSQTFTETDDAVFGSAIHGLEWQRNDSCHRGGVDDVPMPCLQHDWHCFLDAVDHPYRSTLRTVSHVFISTRVNGICMPIPALQNR